MNTKQFTSICIWLHLMVAIFIAFPAQAENDSRVELTPTIGYRFGGEFDNDPLLFDFDFSPEVQDSESYGLTLGIGLTPDWTLEFLYDHQASVLVDHSFLVFPGERLFDLDVTYAHVGVTHEWRTGQARPFVAGSVGATQFSPEPSGLSDETRFSASLGGGVKIMFSDHFGLRFEGRVFSTFLEDDEDFYCYDDYDDCSTDEDLFFQSVARAGLIFRF